VDPSTAKGLADCKDDAGGAKKKATAP